MGYTIIIEKDGEFICGITLSSEKAMEEVREFSRGKICGKR